MYNSKLVALLRTFSSSDLRRFEEYLASPYFNKSQRLVLLFRTLKVLAPDFPEEQCDRYQIWQTLKPGQAASDQEIATEMNALLRQAEAFLCIEHFQQQPQLKDLQLLDALAKRRLDKNYRLQLKRLHQSLDDATVQNERHFLERYQVAAIEVREMLQGQARTYDANLQQMVDYLDDFYLIARLALTCELINRQSILSGSYDTRLAGGLMAYLRNYDHDKVPTMAAFYVVLRLLTGEAGLDDFHRLAKLLNENASAFVPEEWRELFSYAQNFCIRKVRDGEANYLKELFSLYQIALESGNLLEEGILSAWKYKNICSVGLRLHEYDWVQNFITRYRSKLPEDFQETAFAYNMADLLYHKGDHEQALRTLMRVEFTDIFYALDTRKMMLMIYFEQGATEAMLSLITSFRQFLQRNQLISESNRRAYTHFVNFVQAIYRHTDSHPEKLEKLQSQIGETQPLVEEAWLLEKAKRGFSEKR